MILIIEFSQLNMKIWKFEFMKKDVKYKFYIFLHGILLVFKFDKIPT